MAFVAPIIGAIVGGVAATAVGQAVIGGALALGAGYLARKLAPKPRDLGASSAGMRLTLRYDPNAEREVCFGRVFAAGTLVYQAVYGPNGNDYVQFVYAVADHECDGLEGVYVNGTFRTLGALTSNAWVSGQPVSGYGGLIWVAWHAGAWDQAADADLIARSGGAWTAKHRGRGVAYVRVTMLYNPEAFADGVPRFGWLLRGIRLYDPRKDASVGGDGDHRWGEPATYEWTANPAVCLYNWRRGIFVNGERLAGMTTPAAAMPLAEWVAAMNACDETVARADGSGSDPRYRMHGVFAGDENRSVIRAMLTAMAGEEIDTGGVFKLLPGVAQAPVLSITDDDLLIDGVVELTPKVTRAQLVNATLGAFHDPAAAYEAMPLPPRMSPEDEAEDGERWAESYALDLVTDQRQGQRILEILRRKARHQRRVRLPLRASCAVIEAGDWISWTSASYGFVDQLFQVDEAPLGEDLSVVATLSETSAGIFAWNPASDELDPLDPAALPPGGAPFSTVAGIAAENVVLAGGGETERPGIRVTWTPVSDPTVVGIDLEYRRAGDAGVLRKDILDAGSGEFTWVDGVQGATTYEVRLKPLTQPPRAVTWSGWVSTGAATGGQIVAKAVEAESVPPDTITPEMLSAQTRFELSLSTAIASLQGSVAGEIAELKDRSDETALAALAALSKGAENGAQILTERTERVTATTALAQQLDIAATWIGENEAVVAQVIESVDGIKAHWGIAIDINGNVVGTVQLDGDASGSIFSVLANKFAFAHPDIASGAPQSVFIIAEDPDNPGQYRALLNGELIANAIKAGTVAAGTVSSVFASFGVMEAGLMRSADNKFRIDLDNKEIVIEF